MTTPGLLPATAADIANVVKPLFREYGEWVATHLARHEGITLSPAELDRHHEEFDAELRTILSSRGRLLIGTLDRTHVGVGTLKPVDDDIAEIKRMFVRPSSQGFGIGRAILDGLLEHATTTGFTTVRLETLRFMTEARALYARAGFATTEPFVGSEAANTVLEPFTIYMELHLTG